MAIQTLRRNKGTELTHDELDDNFVFINEQLAGKETSGAVAAHVGLADPHTQYHTDARGDARYQSLAAAAATTELIWSGI